MGPDLKGKVSQTEMTSQKGTNNFRQKLKIEIIFLNENSCNN